MISSHFSIRTQAQQQTDRLSVFANRSTRRWENFSDGKVTLKFMKQQQQASFASPRQVKFNKHNYFAGRHRHCAGLKS